MEAAMARLKVTYKKSTIGYAHDQKRTVASLGLRKLNQSVILPDNPAVRGMVFKVRHLVSVEEIAGDPTPEATPRRRARTYGTGGAL
jgi:large subunit ribosomal protein L30